MLYKGYIVINQISYELELTEPWTEEQAQEAMSSFKELSNLWLGLANGDMVAVSKRGMTNVHFLAKPIKA